MPSFDESVFILGMIGVLVAVLLWIRRDRKKSWRYHPCPGCRRHVDTTDPRCPFCDAVRSASEPRAIKMISGRWSRAAVFAGGALISPACGSTTSGPADVKTGPADVKTGPADATTATTTTGPDARPPDTGAGRIVGRLTGDRTGAPIRGAIHFFDAAGKPYTATPDVNGAYVLEVPAGTYTTNQPVRQHPRAQPMAPAVITTVVKAGETATVNISFPEHDPHAIPMPYGAPPARRRIV